MSREGGGRRLASLGLAWLASLLVIVLTCSSSRRATELQSFGGKVEGGEGLPGFPNDEDAAEGYAMQWPEWSGTRGAWVKLPEDPEPGVVPQTEDVPERRSEKREDHPLPEGTGPVDITGVGEGTERVRAGLEGPWGGISSSSLPTTDHEGGGLWRASPRHSSVPIRPVPNFWYDREGAGFPGDITQGGNFPGVSPDNPEGTSSYIGMHRDGEDTLGEWARGGLNPLRGQQLVAVAESPEAKAGGATSKYARGGEAKAAKEGKATSSKAAKGGEAPPATVFDGIDVSDVGETSFDKYVPDPYGKAGTSWVVGVHREPHWSDSMTYACGTTTPCKMGDADRGHYFQRDTNPFVDKRRVFDREGQLDQDNHDTGADSFPWDPTRHPQIFDSQVDCSDGALKPECYARPGLRTEPAAAASARSAHDSLRAEFAQGDIARGTPRLRALSGGSRGHYDTGSFAAEGGMSRTHDDSRGRLEYYSDSDDDWRRWVDEALETHFDWGGGSEQRTGVNQY